MPEKTRKSCLVIAYGPVPTPQYQTVEGGGMRAWGLATGLHSHGLDVTVAVNSGFPQELEKHQGVKLTNWSLDQRFKDLINSYDSVIISYCLGDPSVFVVDNINSEVQLILDVYVPIYVEVSARESHNIDSEYRNYMEDVKRFNHVLRRGDYFLCASQSQKIFYTGVLGALGIVNPRSYRQDRIAIAPLGIHDLPAKAKRNPYKELGVKDDDFLVLWFGGLYPWFQVDEFLAAIQELSKDPKIKFAIVGGKNPFNPNPDFSKQYEHALEFAKKHDLLGKSLIFVDWVDFDDRINWYGRANLVISINKPGEENSFSWRTRVMDYVWGELPILTNGGDPLSEQLLTASAAIRLDNLSHASMISTIKHLANNRGLLASTKKSLLKVKGRYFWQHITEPVAKIIETAERPSSEEARYRKKLKLTEPSELSNLTAPAQSKLRQTLSLSRRAISYARRKGLRRSAHLALTIARTQAKKRSGMSRGRRYIFISNPVEDTGAALVVLEIIEEYAEKYGAKNVQLITNHILSHHLRRLREKGIKVDKAAMGLGNRLLELQLGLKPDDFVLINTVAVYHNYLDYTLKALSAGKLNHAFWFIHEDVVQTSFVASQLNDKKEIGKITALTNKGKLSILVPSKRVSRDYQKLWDIQKVNVVNLKVHVPKKYKQPRPASDYSKINFLLSGPASDARKGQAIAISAFYSYLKTYYDKNPKNYRDFRLNFVNIGDDYVSRNVKIMGESLLGNKLKINASLPFNEAMALTSKCNAVICTSLNETFGLYIAEGMMMGHVVLRNNSAGIDEQLKDGVNGYFIDHTDINDVASKIEKILNKTKTSNDQLQKMGAASQKLIAKYQDNSYLKQIENLK